MELITPHKGVIPFVSPSGDEMVIITKKEYIDFIKKASNAEDAALNAFANEVLQDIANGDDEFIPFEMHEALSVGDVHPVRIWREHRGMTAKQLAEKASITAPYLSDIETEKRNPGVDVLVKLSKVLNTTVDDLIPMHIREE